MGKVGGGGGGGLGRKRASGDGTLEKKWTSGDMGNFEERQCVFLMLEMCRGNDRLDKVLTLDGWRRNGGHGRTKFRAKE